MDLKKIAQLKNILKKANSGNSKEIKDEAKEFLKTIDANDLITAEQKLIDEGVQAEDLRSLCAAHLELMGEQIKGKYEDLEDKHPIKILFEEHEEILKFLNELEELNKKFQSVNKYSDIQKEDLSKLKEVAHHLVAAEKHHKREEDVLFPKMENLGVYGPPQIMAAEHVELRATKKAIDALANSNIENEFLEFKKELDWLSKSVIFNLREHIFKENNILYPASLELIKDEKEWEDIREKCDSIGYCCFTPKHLSQK